MEVNAEDLEIINESAATTDKENIPSGQAEPNPPADQPVVISVTSASDSSDAKPASSDYSTPLPTVRDRINDYHQRTGQGDDGCSVTSGNRSLSSSQSSLRGVHLQGTYLVDDEKSRLVFDKDDKDWILAASACDKAAMQRMLSRSGRRQVNCRFPFNGFSALHFAAKMNRMDCCKFLLDNGADPDAKTYAGQTPLHMACQQESREAMEYLMKLPSRASHTPDYSGKLPHELIRSRDAFGDILYGMSSSGLAKRGSFLGEFPTRAMIGSLKSQEAAAVLASNVAASASSSSSWLSGVRASFRGKAAAAAGGAGSQQPRLKSGGGSVLLRVPGSAGQQQHGNRVPLLLQQSPAGFALPCGPVGSILDSLASGAAVAGHGCGGGHQHRHHGDKKKHRFSKKTL